MTKRTRKGMFREFKMRKQEDLGRSYNKYHKLVIRDMIVSTDVTGVRPRRLSLGEDVAVVEGGTS